MNQESGITTVLKSFTSLDAWKEGHKLVLLIYELTKSFPKEEIFGLVSQMRRCAVSITSNIAEGFSRQSYKEKLQFYSIALGSVTELQNQLLIAKDVGFISKEKFQEIANQSVKVHKIINGLIKKSKSIIHDS
jgi:four helix bundle protein